MHPVDIATADLLADESAALAAPLPRPSLILATGGLALLALLLATLGLMLSDGRTGYAPLWLANGVVTAALLRFRSLRALPTLIASGAALIGANLIYGTAILPAFGFGLVNAGEIALAYWLVRRFAPPSVMPGGASPDLARFFALAGGIAPLAAALAGGAVASALYGSVFSAVALHWFTADALGMIVGGTFVIVACTPDCLSLLRERRRLELSVMAIGVAAVTAMVFAQSRYPAIFVILPLLTVAAFRLRFVGAAASIGVVAIVASYATMNGMGPIAARLAEPGERILFLQLFVAVAAMSTLPTAATLVERERLTRVLREQRRAYRLLAEHSNDMIVRLGLDGIHRYVSPASRAILGRSPGELMGKTSLPDIHPEDRAVVEAAFTAVMDTDDQPTFTYRMRHRNGDYVWLEATCRLVRDAAGAPSEYVVTARNVTRRREAEVRLSGSMAQLQESLRLLAMAERMGGVGHWRLDVATRALFWSDEVYRIHGRAIGDLPDIDAAIKAYHPDDRAMVSRHVERAITQGLPWSFRARLIRVDGSIRQVESSGEAERADDGRIVGVVGVFRDVTDEAAAEAALIAARDEAHALARAKSTFLATMSHEIRTPMTGVLGMIELLRTDPASDARAHYLENLAQSAGLLMALLDDVLDFSKIESDAMPLERTDFDLGALARSALDLFHHAASSKGLQISLAVPVGRDLIVAGDPVRLQQIIANLVSNAIKFTPAGRIDVAFDLVRDGDVRIVQGRVRDTGIGIDPAVIPGLFEPFRQADASTTRRFGGTGLGLAISQRLAEAMGGGITVESMPGHGATFSFVVRLHAPQARAATAPLIRRAPGRALSILLAEDNAINRALVDALVRRDGHRLVAVENGRLAVERAADERFDLILMDMQMPEMDGIQALRAIRNGGGVNATTAIVALTADAAPERRSRYEEAGLDGFLTKPIDSAALAAVLHRVADVTAAPPSPPNETLLDEAKLASLTRAVGAEQVDRLLAMMTRETAAGPPAILRAIADGDRAAAARAAHDMKGAALSIGATRLAEALRGIERAAETDAPLEPLAAPLSAAASATAAAIAARRRSA